MWNISYIKKIKSGHLGLIERVQHTHYIVYYRIH